MTGGALDDAHQKFNFHARADAAHLLHFDAANARRRHRRDRRDGFCRLLLSSPPPPP